MASPEKDDNLSEKDDYYAWLGLNKTASQEDINGAFRRMSRMYHPDKHNTTGHKRQAEELFAKINRAHEVLSDPQLRAIYDTTGVKGLETNGWQVVQRTKSPKEILEEYKRLLAEEEERKLQQQTNPYGNLSVGLDLSPVFDSYSDSESVLGQTSISQSVMCPLTTKDIVTLAGSVTSDRRKGMGSIKTTYRHVFSHNAWTEGEVEFGSSNSSVQMRGFRSLWNKAFGTLSGSIQIMSEEFVPLGSAVIVQQLDRRVQGRLECTVSTVLSSLRTSVTWRDGPRRLTGTIQLGVPSMFVKFSYFHELPQYDLHLHAKLKVGNLSVLGEYGCVKKITQFSTLSASMSVGAPSGVTLHIRLQRGNQSFSFPVFLCDEVSLEPILYGTVVPLVVYAAIKVLVVNPFLKLQKEKDLQRKKEVNAQWKAEKKKDAESALELMRETIDRIVETEEGKAGLVLRKALYGKLEGGESVDQSECVNVTRQLQALVTDSKLLLPPDTQLSELPGFYDPCVGEEKQLSITYHFRRQLHTCKFNEKEKILIPNRNHLCEKT